TDRVLPTPKPQRWQVGRLMGAAGILAALSLLASALLYWWAQSRGLSDVQLQTVVFLILVFTNQTGIYALRNDDRLWRLAPSRWMEAASVGDIVVVSLLAGFGLLMAAVPWSVVLTVLVASAVFAMLLDAIKRPLFTRFDIA
ncbi:MAG: plasma-membrane proton-efflux P-type ATPase, partial [Steroidobacteraceae bacterium]